MKTITICDKEYEIDCNAFTYVKYQTFFKSGILKDMSIAETYLLKQNAYAEELNKKDMSDEDKLATLGDMLIDDTDEFVRIITQIAWILIYSANNKIEDYDTWLKSIKNFKIDDNWVVEVTEFAVDCFCR